MINNECSRVQLAIEIIAAPSRRPAVRIRCLCVLALVSLTGCLYLDSAGATTLTQTRSGIVTRVVDGDTIWVNTGQNAHPLKVRILGIDAPEICQTGGDLSREALKQRVLGQFVTVSFKRYDIYGRSLASVVWQSEDVGRWMVVNGYAWSYRFHRSAGPYATEQMQAVYARRGIFSAGTAQNPRTFRKRHGSCYS